MRHVRAFEPRTGSEANATRGIGRSHRPEADALRGALEPRPGSDRRPRGGYRPPGLPGGVGGAGGGGGVAGDPGGIATATGGSVRSVAIFWSNVFC